MNASSAKLLALETSSATGSVALALGDDVRERVIATAREQTQLILPVVDGLLEEAGFSLGELDAIVFGRGPGSFTGLRVAAAIAQGLGLASGRPLLGVSSLGALAQRAWREHGVMHSLTCVDARMGEVYWAEYRVRDGLAACLGDERLGPPATVSTPSSRPFGAVGDGFAAHADALAESAASAEQVLAALVPAARDLLPRARLDLACGRGLGAAAAQPVYLRGANAWKQQ